MKISKSNNIKAQYVFIDGLPGCGKTLFSPIVSSFNNVEQFIFSYEVEQYCGLYSMGNLNLNTASVMIKEALELRTYNLMMSREVNFRPTDLSSVLKYCDPEVYISRLFSLGDEDVLRVLKEKEPIINIATHQSLAYSEPIWHALVDDCVFIEIVRHPAYMVQQQEVNFKSVSGAERDFDLNILHNDIEVPYYAAGWEDEYIKSTPIEKSIRFIYHHTILTEKFKSKVGKKQSEKILTIPFEDFVVHPDSWIVEIEKILNTKSGHLTKKVMKEQKVPRGRYADGLDLEIYKRFGWRPSIQGVDEKKELDIRKREIFDKVSCDCSSMFNIICDKYEDRYDYILNNVKP